VGRAQFLVGTWMKGEGQFIEESDARATVRLLGDIAALRMPMPGKKRARDPPRRLGHATESVSQAHSTHRSDKEKPMKVLRKLMGGAAALAAAAVFAGCSQNLGDFTLLATKNVDLSNFSTQVAESSQKVTGVDKSSIIVFVPTGAPNLKEATDRAEEQGNALALTNARIKMSWWYIPYIYGEFQYEVSGNPVPR